MSNGYGKLLSSAHVAAAGLILLALEYGVPIRSPVISVLIGLIGLFFVLSILLPARGSTLRVRIDRDRWTSIFVFLFLACLATCAVLSLTGAAPPGALGRVGLTGLRVFVALASLKILATSLGNWLTVRVNAALIPPMTFVLVIVAGSILLMLPEATSADVSPLNSAFTATSATCVTGLIVQDTGHDFTLFGQAVILLLIQVGGLGLMTFVAFFVLFLGHSVGLKESLSFSMVMDSEFVSDLKRTLAHIVFWTLSIEAVGAILLYMTWRPLGMHSSSLQTIWHSVFHSVSAFCNAGFSLNTTNMEPYASSPATCVVMGSLIVLGGLGFSVLAGLTSSFFHRLRRQRRNIITVHVRLVLVVTAFLIAGTMLLFLVGEWNNTLAGMSAGEKVANAFLESVTPRTAGFNTVPTHALSPAIRWVFTGLMFIGASPGGTGGGVKTTTVALLLLTAVAILRRRHTIDLWGRRIAIVDVMRAASVFVLACIVFSVSVSLLLLSERASLGAEAGRRFEIDDYIFESMSAFGTVGLSTGVTGELTPVGRLVIMVTMFLGRIGPLTLAVVSGKFIPVRYTYPEARVTIG